MASSNKKILIATGIFPPQVGGPATYSKLLLTKLPERGFDVRVLNFGDFLKYPKVVRHIKYFLALLKIGKNQEIIFAQDPVSVGLPAMLASKVLKKKFYLKIVGDYAWEQGTQRHGVKDLLDTFSLKSGYPIFVQILKFIQTLVSNSANKIVTPSNYLKKIISNWGVPKEKITVIYNAFEAPKITLDKKILRKKFDWDQNIIISAGRLVPWKGFDLLIDLMTELDKTGLYIAGEGPEKSNLIEQVQKNNLQDQVIFLGGLKRDELFERIKAADVFVLNTSYEGLSHQLLEVMALGTPIVTTTAGGNIETIENEISGFLVEYNDKEALLSKIKILLNDENLKIKFTANAQKRLENFKEEKMLDEISTFLRA